jgi:hypothetical protein
MILKCVVDNNYLSISGIQCLAPPIPPNESSLETSRWDGSPINFYSNVTFVCQRKQKFYSDFSQQNVQAQCLPNNTWALPNSWGLCVESKLH